MALNEKRLEKSVRKLRKILRKRSKALRPRDVHDLRTRSRRIESAIDAMQLSSRSNERKLLRNLSRIRKKAGKVRDMDVLTSHLLDLHIKGDGDCLTRLAEHLGIQRYKHAEKLRRTIKRYGGKTRRRLNRTRRRFQRAIESDGAAGAQSLQSTMAAAALQHSTDLASPPALNRGNLHPYRIKIKELRYVLQAGEGGDREFMDALSEAKDAIGEWHDWEEMIAIAEEVLDHQPNCALMDELKKISREKYVTALSSANRLRAEYLTPQSKNAKGKQPVYKHESTQPALRAVASLAS